MAWRRTAHDAKRLLARGGAVDRTRMRSHRSSSCPEREYHSKLCSAENLTSPSVISRQIRDLSDLPCDGPRADGSMSFFGVAIKKNRAAPQRWLQRGRL